MKHYIFIFLMIFIFGCDTQQTENDNFPLLEGKYIGQNEPGLTPEIFAPDIVSTGMTEINACFSPDFSEFFYSIILPNRKFVIITMKYKNNRWTKPEVADFSGYYSDADPFITKDGKWLYFVSKRNEDSTKSEKKDWDIWRMAKIDKRWQKPEKLAKHINSDTDDIYPTVSDNGTLYFSSGRNGMNNRDIFYSETLADTFNVPIMMSDTINAYWEGDICVSPDEDFLIFRSYGRKEGNGLFITFKQDNSWQMPIRMGEEINMTSNELCPMISPDGKYFFFSSAGKLLQTENPEIMTYKKIKDEFVSSYQHPQMGKTDIYWISTEIIEKYRDKNQ